MIGSILVGGAGMSDELKAYYNKMQLGRYLPAIEKQPIDCRSEEGITIGLIDAIISISRVLNHRIMSYAAGRAVEEALADLGSDDDVTNIIEHARLAADLEDKAT